MMYDIEQFLNEYSKRIVENNKLVEQSVAGHGQGYEITQKVSSLSALMTVCYQKYEDRSDIEFDTGCDPYNILEKLINYLMTHNCLYCNYVDTAKRKASITPNGRTNVEAFLYHLRNSFAHGGPGLNFFPVDVGEIGAITHIFLRDIHDSQIFVVKLSVKYEGREQGADLPREDDLSILIDLIPKLYIGREKSIGKGNNRLARNYNKEIKLLEALLHEGGRKVEDYFSNSEYLTKEEKNAYHTVRH